MRKFLLLIIILPFIAASCDAGGIFDFGGGTRGVFKSEDGGKTFNAFNALENKGDISSLSVNSFAFDPTNPDKIYLGVSGGIYKSENGAKSWRYVLSGINVAGVAVDRFSPNTIYAAGVVGQNGKIIKSTDGGSSWVDVYTEPSKSNTVLSIAVAPTSASTIIAGLNNGELIRSTDGGRTWQTTMDFADRVLAVKFNSSSVAYALTARKGLFKSLDLGVDWVSISNNLTGNTLNSVNNSATSISAFYELALDLRQQGVLYLGTEQGLHRTVNDGKDWSFLALPVRNAALRVSAVTVDPSNSNIVFAAVASTLYKSVNGGLTWETRTLPTTTAVRTIVINPNSTNIIYLGLRPQ